MSATIEIDQNQLNKTEEIKLHYLPAKIDGYGNAKVEEYFTNYTKNENDVLHNALRGYPLNGRELNIPEGYRAVVLQEPPSLDQERKLRVTGAFKKFTYWNYDKLPSQADAYVQAMQWAELSRELSTPVSEGDVLAEIAAHKELKSGESVS